MIELIDVSKQYDGRSIIHRSDYVLPSHGIYCLDGENGSGKSTILGVIAGAVLPDSGAVHIDGRPCRISDRSIKKKIAYVPDACPIYPFITGDEFLALVQSIRNSSALELEYLSLAGLPADPLQQDVSRYRQEVYVDIGAHERS